jgi:hypothetical protein
LAGHRIRCWKAENNCDEANPSNRYKSDGARKKTEIEGSFAGVEVLGVDQANEDGDAVGDVEADCGDGGSCCESYCGAKRGEGETECEKGSKPDGADGGTESVVDFVEEVGLGNVSIPIFFILHFWDRQKKRENSRYHHL